MTIDVQKWIILRFSRSDTDSFENWNACFKRFLMPTHNSCVSFAATSWRNQSVYQVIGYQRAHLPSFSKLLGSLAPVGNTAIAARTKNTMLNQTPMVVAAVSFIEGGIHWTKGNRMIGSTSSSCTNTGNTWRLHQWEQLQQHVCLKNQQNTAQYSTAQNSTTQHHTT